jgi:hypothetical protein
LEIEPLVRAVKAIQIAGLRDHWRESEDVVAISAMYLESVTPTINRV